MVRAVALNVVDVDPAATNSDAAGTGSKLLLLARLIVAPPVSAGLFRVMVQVVAAAELRLAGVQARELSNTGANRLMLAVCDVPFRVAVTVTV